MGRAGDEGAGEILREGLENAPTREVVARDVRGETREAEPGRAEVRGVCVAKGGGASR